VAKCFWTVICQRALIDQTGNLSLIQIIDEFGLPPPPENMPSPIGAIIPFAVSIVTSWKRAVADKPEKQLARLRLFSPQGKQFASADFEVDLIMYEKSRCLAELPGISYQGPGIYVVRVEATDGKRWRKVGQTEFKIHHNVPQPNIVKH
jgi:hypothetical protein